MLFGSSIASADAVATIRAARPNEDNDIMCESSDENEDCDIMCESSDEVSGDGVYPTMHSTDDSEQNSAERPSKRYRKHFRSTRSDLAYEVAGYKVCLKALISLLGVGDSTVERLRNGQGRITREEPKHPTLKFSMLRSAWSKWPSVLQFLWFTYHSCAEALPHKFIAGDVKEKNNKRVVMDPVLSRDVDNDSDEIDRNVAQIALQLDSYSGDPASFFCGPGTLQGGADGCNIQGRSTYSLNM